MRADMKALIKAAEKLTHCSGRCCGLLVRAGYFLGMAEKCRDKDDREILKQEAKSLILAATK